MKTLYLHIGSHKTATTSIQNAFYQHQEILGQHGYSFFTESSSGRTLSSGNTSDWIDCDHEALRNGYGGKLHQPETLFEKLSAKPGNVIMSAEHFSWLFNADEINMIRQHAQKNFNNIKIIIYLRRQDKLVISHHQQASKGANLPAFGYYSGDSFAIPKSRANYDEYLDYNKKITLWADAFGTENISIRILEKNNLHGEDAVIDFFNLLGIKDDIQSLTVNESNGFERTKVGHLVSQHLPPSPLAHLIRKGADNSGKLLPSRSEAIEFYSRYIDSNKALNRTYKISETDDIFDNDFSFYPEAAQDTWTEDSANRAITNILHSISPFSSLKIDHLKDAALALKHTHPELSYALINTAHQLRPEDELISQNLNEISELK